MKLSWSHNLFLFVNQWAGQSRAYDAVVRFWAQPALFGLAAAVIIWLWWQYPQAPNLLFIFGWLPVMWLVGIGISGLIGWLYPHPRPIVELPKVREIIKPLSNWKSLPSDHAFSAWLLVFAAAFGPANGNPLAWPIWIFAFCALCISIARVLAGVHYPRDIVAGTALAGVVAWAFFR